MRYKRLKQSNKRRKYRVRKKVKGDADRPRLSVYRSNKNITAQVIDDRSGVTLASASTMQEALKKDIGHGGNSEAAKAVGETLAKRASEVGIKLVRFDRGAYRYHGRVKALADAAREAGLVF
ncbi:50S ribosomal protein L18 [Sedimentisphaera cyanobacteriorum]|uniref:Large ribosomal subunit protein uL18 n=1 Tax=Sedimentisphaera cyanobacteriorum TaxID=1940790 RepID=A0A1Q2HQ90_9BACT|nr:50S ribosomal protein L18 [Sedimentisphaera cyanobacteriorum]AQQ09415.1 50S ribosomal protein L18 [Sedimentisphaera cyanobacteriorum]